jgi:asparagine synthase (glutamine-hydrolysing)
MFAFAVWDEPKKSLFLARDRMGQKPLYYALLADEPLDGLIDDFGTARAIAFASELAALAPLSWVKHECSEAALRQYLAVGYVGSGATIYMGVAKLQPSWWVRVSAREVVRHHYSKSVEFGAAVSDEEARASTRRLVEQAVSRQLVADVPLGCFLSGGVDSSVVAAAMKKAAHGGDVLTFSIGFDDPRYDESCYASEVARQLGTRHFNFEVSPDAASDLPALAAAYGEPFGDSSALPTHYLSRETRRHVKVALSGDGGDELFGGYDRYSAMRKSENLPLVMRVAAHTAAAAIPGRHPKSFGSRLRRFAAALYLDTARRYSAYVRLFSKAAVDELLVCDDRSDDLIEICFDSLLGRAKISGEPVDAARASMAFDRITYLPDDLLTKLDRASMLHALEVRSPFMDHELVQFAAGLTTDQLLKGGPKRMLREAFAQDLPAWVFKRKKMGFAVPIGEWFRGQLRPMLHDHLFAADSFAGSHFDLAVVRRLVDEHEQQRFDHSQRLYALLMLELWWRTCREKVS